MVSDFKDLNNIYRIILALPMLKYYKFSANEFNIDLSFPMATVEQFNLARLLQKVSKMSKIIFCRLENNGMIISQRTPHVAKIVAILTISKKISIKSRLIVFC